LDAPDLFISPIVKLRKDITNLGGSSACVSSWQRISDGSMPPRVKAGANYVSGRYAHLEANKSGYDLPIFLNSKGTVAEGAGACIFIVKKNELITPTLQCSILESITRDTLVQLSRVMGLKVNEREVNRSELLIADEIFLCGSAAEITPITSLNNVLIGDGCPGPVTISLHEKYLQIVSNDSAQIPGTDWLSVVQ
jgi:branched-chain amino acid aminotransferase